MKTAKLRPVMARIPAMPNAQLSDIDRTSRKGSPNTIAAMKPTKKVISRSRGDKSFGSAAPIAAKMAITAIFENGIASSQSITVFNAAP